MSAQGRDIITNYYYNTYSYTRIILLKSSAEVRGALRLINITFYCYNNNNNSKNNYSSYAHVCVCVQKLQYPQSRTVAMSELIDIMSE